MKNSNFKELVMPVLILFTICLVIAAALVVTYQITAPVIADVNKANSDAARTEVLSDAGTFSEIKDIELIEGVIEVYKADNDSGIVITTIDKGFGGEITFMTGLDMDGKMTGIKVLNHTETPGLGTKTMTQEHIGQYLGKDKIEGVNAITGVTISSKAMERGVQKALDQFEAMKSKGVI